VEFKREVAADDFTDCTHNDQSTAGTSQASLCRISCVHFMAALRSRYRHYMFVLWFLLSSFFSSPVLSGRRLDVCHTSTHGVALMRI